MRPCHGLAAMERGSDMLPWSFERRDLREDDVAIRIRYCGVCHSDLHAVNKGSRFPLVPGHEIVGDVVAVGSAVTQFTPGQAVVAGTIVDSCGHCDPCASHQESYCQEGVTTTYSGTDRQDGSTTRGGYSNEIVVHNKFVYPLPTGLEPASVAPLLCAGITTWSPLRHWQAGPGTSVGIIGLGGLGHMAVKFAKALGAHVVLFTRSPDKVEAGLALGADEVVLSTDDAQMKRLANRLDLILNTAAEAQALDPYLRTLKLDGTLCSLNIPAQFDFTPVLLTLGRRRLTSSGVGGTKETSEMLAFCSERGIAADVEIIRADDINHAFERLARGDVRYRLVIDMDTLTAPVAT